MFSNNTKNMRVLLANPPWVIDRRYGVRAGSRWPFTLRLGDKDQRDYVPFPFFIAYAAALLEKDKKEVVLIDAVADGVGEDVFLERVNNYAPQIIVFETSTPSFENDIRIARRIKHGLKNAQIVFCGTHASVFPVEILEGHDFINYVLMGEYEYTLRELIKCLEEGQDLKDVLGLAYRREGRVEINKQRPAARRLDDLPWPERETLPMHKYNDGFCDLPRPNVQMLASRGCPYQCIFCLWPQVLYGEHLYRKRDPHDVIDEMEWLLSRYGFKAVYFDDDTFNVDSDYVEEICKEINKRKIEIPWAIMARPDLMNEKVLKNLLDAGLCAVKYGIESADKRILKSCGKNMDLDKARRMINFTKKLGIKVHLTFCLGLPGETDHTIQKTIAFIEDIRPDSLQFSFATPIPGTAYFNYVKDRGWLDSTDWSDFDGNNRCIVRTQELSSKQLEQAKIDISHYFNLQ